MLKRLRSPWQRAALTSFICFGLLIAACTRSATTATVPTAGPTGAVSGTEAPGATQSSGQDATMNAVGTQVSGQLTQTAVATSGGQATTPGAPGTAAPAGADTDTPAPGQPTNTPGPAGYPGNTPGAPAPTESGSVPADTATPVPAVAGVPCANPYTVQPGDWIYKIARNCGVSVAALIAANPGINADYISPGQQLNMPGAGATPGSDPVQAGCSGQHTVATGESLYRIAFSCGLTVEQVAAANNIVYPYTIYVGQTLTIP